MKKLMAQLLILFFLFTNAQAQTLGISPNGKYIASNFNGVSVMMNEKGKVLYPIENISIYFTPDEKHYFFCEENIAQIFETKTGKHVKKLPVKGSRHLKIDNNLKRYGFIFEEDLPAFGLDGISITHIYNGINDKPLILESKRRCVYSFIQNIAIVFPKKHYELVDLKNPEHKTSLKVKKPDQVAIDDQNGNIVISSLKFEIAIFDKTGKELSVNEVISDPSFDDAISDWYIYTSSLSNINGKGLGKAHFNREAFFSQNSQLFIVPKSTGVKYYNLINRQLVNELEYKEVHSHPENKDLINYLRQKSLYNSDHLCVIHNFEKDYTSWKNDNKSFAIRGNKYWFSNGDPNGTNSTYQFLDSILKLEHNFHIEASVKFLEGETPFFGISNTERIKVTVSPEGDFFSKFNYNEKKGFSYCVNKGKERNIVELDKTKDYIRAYINGELVQDIEGNYTNYSGYGFIIQGRGLAEADYIMVSPIRDAEYYQHWRKQAGLNVDPIMAPEFQGHAGVITDVQISPDGKEIVSCGKDKTIRIWDIKTGENIRTFRTSFGKGDVGVYHKIAISPDKKYIAAGGYFSDPDGYEMGHVRFLDYQTGEVIHVYDRLTGSIQSMEFSPPSTPFKEQMFLVGSANGENHFFRYHHFVNNLKNSFAEPDYKKIDVPMENTWVTEMKLNPTHDEFLIVMDHWKFVRTFNLNHSNLGEGTTEVEIKGDDKVVSACYSAGGDSIIVVRINQIDIYDLAGNPIGNIPAERYPSNAKVFALPDGEHILIKDEMYNIKTGKQTMVKTGNLNASNEGTVNQEGIYAFAGYTLDNPEEKTGWNYAASQEIGVFDLKTGQQITQLKSKTAGFEGIAFSSDDKGIVFTRNYLGLEGAKTFTNTDIINYFDFEKLDVANYKGNPVSNNLIYEYQGKKLERWGVEADGDEDLGKLRYGDVAIREDADYTAVISYTLTSDGYAIVGTTFSLLLFNEEGEKVADFTGHSGGVKALALSNDGSKLLSLGQDRTVKLWDLSKKLPVIEPTATFVMSRENDWICANNKNYYASSKYGVKYLGFLIDRGSYTEADYYPFDQFDLQYNRPDKVLETLGTGDEKLITAYEKAYQRRLKKLPSKTLTHVQNKRLPYILEISPSQVVNKLTHSLSVKGCDGNSIDGFSHFNFWVNDVQIFPEQPPTDNSEMELTIPVDLTPGRNIITVQPVSKAGLSGIKKQVIYFADVPAQTPDLYLVAIGVSEYSNNTMNLKYAAKDASDVVSQMKAAGNFGQVKTQLITNTNATRENILAAKNMLKKAKPNDVAVVYLAGHGLLSEDLNWYFATTDIDFAQPEKKGLAYAEVEGLFDSIPSRNRLLLLDACHSGEVDKESMTLASANMAANIGARGFKAVKKPEMGLDNSFKLMKTLFGSLEKGTGAVVISSAGGGEFAFESSQWKNGLFTYCLLNGLKTKQADKDKNGEITVSELRNYVMDEVKRLSKGKQTPTARKENINNDYVIFQ